MKRSMTSVLLTGAAALALGTSAMADDSELLVLDWSGYEEEGFLTAYIEKHGDVPTYTFFGDDEEAFQKLRSGFRADVSHPCPQSVGKWRDAGLIEPWDLSKIPNWKDVDPAFKTAPILTDGDDVYYIPADMGATAIAYNTEQVPAEDVASLNVFVNPKYAGRISLPDGVDDAFSLGFLATGVSDWTKATLEDVDKAAAFLREAHQLNRAYWVDGAELAQLMGTGEVLVSWAWNETPVQMSDDGHPIAFNRTPTEGSSTWTCGYVNLVDGPGSEDKAHDFVNGWLDAGTTDYIVSEWGYGNGNATAMAAIDAETLQTVGLGPIEAPVLAQLPMDNAVREKMVAEFEKIKAGF